MLLTLTACDDFDEPTLLDELQVSSSYIAIPSEGGSTSITLNAKYDWVFEGDYIPDWLTITPMSGEKGNYTVTFSASEVDDTRSASLEISCADKTQIIMVTQGEAASVEDATIAEVLEGPNSKTYRVTGTVVSIANTTYGNFYMNDGTSETDLYIYGTVNSSGSYAWDSFGVEVGDVVTVEGPKSVYGGVVELVDATFISVTKSLISVASIEPEDGILPKEGGEAIVTLSCSGNGVTVNVPDEAKDWLSITSIESNSSGADVTFKATENTGGDRSCLLTFYTTSGSKEYTCQATISQEGSIMPVSILEFNASPVGSTQYRIMGYITSVANQTYGNFYIKDFSAETYVYGLDGFSSLGINEGDILTIVGKRDEYNGTIEMVDAVLEEHTVVTPISVADFRELADDSNTYYRLTGKVTKSTEDNTAFDLDTYGNFALTDDTGSVYIYGVSTGVNGEDKQFGTLGVKEGDEITIICYKTSYHDLIEAGGAMYISHTSAQ